MNYFNGQHYASLKSIADWLNHIDKNGSYTEIYHTWGEMSTEEQIIELKYLETILNEYIENEQDEVWLDSFKSALETIVKIQSELVGGLLMRYKTTFTCLEDAEEYALGSQYRRNGRNWEFNVVNIMDGGEEVGKIYVGDDEYYYPENFVEKVE